MNAVSPSSNVVLVSNVPSPSMSIVSEVPSEAAITDRAVYSNAESEATSSPIGNSKLVPKREVS